jgi:hypothetical protein
MMATWVLIEKSTHGDSLRWVEHPYISIDASGDLTRMNYVKSLMGRNVPNTNAVSDYEMRRTL